MRLALLCMTLVLVGVPFADAGDGASEPRLERTIALPGVTGRIDHLTVDSATGRLFIAALGNGSIEVVDLAKGERVMSAPGLKEPQGVVFVPGTQQVVVSCAGDGTVRAFDSSTLEARGSIALGEDADNIRLGANGKELLVGYGSGGLAVLDAATLREIGDVTLPGHPESFQIDSGSRRAFINIPGGARGGRGEVAVADLASQKVTATWMLKEAGSNFPMALDAEHRRLYVGCRRPAKLLVLDLDSGDVIASPVCVGDADDIFVERSTGHVLIVGGAGAIDVFESSDQQSYTKVSSVQTAAGARTGLLVPELDALFIAVPKRGSQQAEIRGYSLPD